MINSCNNIEHTKWGENAVGTLTSIISFLSRDQLSLSVNIIILKSEVNTMTASPSTDMIASPPFSRFIGSSEFSDISFRVIEDKEEEEMEEEASSIIEENDEKEGDKKGETEIMNENKGKFWIFHGHKNILAVVSPWYNILFTNGMKESSQKEITISGVKHDIFYRLLKYCYTFKIDMDGVNDTYEMLKASDRFQIANIREESLCYLRQELNENNT